MENRLISMVDFVKYEHQIWDESSVAIVDDIDYINRTSKYAKLLSQPLQKCMFVPCGEDGEVLEYTKTPYEEFCDKEAVCRVFSKEEVSFQKAKERCLFEGLTSIKINDLYFIERDNKSLFCTGLDDVKTIEDLIKYNLILTATALKQIEG